MVLERTVAIVKFLAVRGLAFRGDLEKFGDVRNGNFLGCCELIAQFDPFLANHIDKYNPGSGKVSYFSKTIYEEFIGLMGNCVHDKIKMELKAAKYYSIVVDSTPDVSHCDQLAFIIRYIKNNQPIERFVKYIPAVGHKAVDMELACINTINELNISITYCRGQSYDNAANMSGKYAGLQAKIKEYSKTANFVPCSAHSLNLVGISAADCCQEAILFFSTLDSVYNFFSGSTGRWIILEKHLKSTKKVKQLSQTRWSARYDATSALLESYTFILNALDEILNDECNNSLTKCEATGIKNNMTTLNFAVMLVLWNKLLERINSTSKILQDPQINLSVVVKVYDSLVQFIHKEREMFCYYESTAKSFCNEEYRKSNKRIVKRKKQFD